MKQEMFSQSTSLFLIISGKHSELGPYNLVTMGMISFSQFLRKKKKNEKKKIDAYSEHNSAPIEATSKCLQTLMTIAAG